MSSGRRCVGALGPLVPVPALATHTSHRAQLAEATIPSLQRREQEALDAAQAEYDRIASDLEAAQKLA